MDEEVEIDNKLTWLEVKSRFLLKDGIDLDKKVIYIEGKISPKSLSKFTRQLRLLESLNDNPITVMIDSGGGDVYSMFGFIDRIQTSPNSIITIGTSLIASAALPILASGHHRYVTKYCSLMHHSASFDAGHDRLPSQENEIKHVKDLEKRICSFLASVTNKPYTFWLSSGKHLDYFFGATEAVELGIADEII